MDQKSDLQDWESDPEQVEMDKPKKNTVGELANTGYAGIHSTGFKDFMFRPEIQRSIQEAGFEHPSEVQQEAIPKAINGSDILCQAKSGMGKTAVFVSSILHRLGKNPEPVSALVLCHARELAFQIYKEFNRIGKYLTNVKTKVFYGGDPINEQKRILNNEPPTIIVGTPGRILDLIRRKHLKLNKLKFFVLDECDKVLEELDMRGDVQNIFKETPTDKQVMMFSATMSKGIRQVCIKFMQKQQEIFIDNEAKLTLHGLAQYYLEISENEKIKRLLELIDQLQFNQVIIFVRKTERADFLCKYLNEQTIPAITCHGAMKQHERIAKFSEFYQCGSRVMVTTDVFGRGIDIAKVNIVFNFDMPDSTDSYLHRVGRAGRFGTKGLAITFVANQEEKKILDNIQERFAVQVNELTDSIDPSQYLNN